jgi:hypothetical protein
MIPNLYMPSVDNYFYEKYMNVSVWKKHFQLKEKCESQQQIIKD